MKLLGSNKVIIILCIGLFFFKSSYSDDAVDIWKKNPQDKSINKISPKTEDKKIKIRLITIRKFKFKRISKLMSHYQNLH